MPALPEPSAAALAHGRRLLDLLARDIAAAGGWIDFARYLELALYAPGLGYYSAGAGKFGGGGDFITAPEISPLFGRALARPAAEVLGQCGGAILEIGAGTGRLALDLLGQLEADGALPDRYLILDRSADLRQRQRALFAERAPHLLARIDWLATLPEKFTGLVLANELLDALPVHLVAWRPEGTFERGVAWRDGLAWRERPLPPGPLAEAAGRIAWLAAAPPAAPYVSEINLAGPALVMSLGAMLERGALLLIDYGFGRAEYYHPQRAAGTLMCHYRHHAHDDPFYLPGLQDITAHVDFTAIAEAGLDAGLELLGYTSQAALLIDCGITGLLEGLDTGGADYARRVAGAQKLLSPAEMGELFKAIALGKGLDAPPAGFRGRGLLRML